MGLCFLLHWTLIEAVLLHFEATWKYLDTIYFIGYVERCRGKTVDKNQTQYILFWYFCSVI